MTEPHPSRFPGITWAAIRAELAREAAQRRSVYPGWCAKGNLTQAEADWQIAAIDAIAADALRFERAFAARTNPLEFAPGHTLSWADRRKVLLRELDYRSHLYPGWIRKGNLAAADADRQCACLQAMLALYEDGMDWIPANGTPPAYGEAHPTADQSASRHEWQAVAAGITARLHPPAQEQMAL